MRVFGKKDLFPKISMLLILIISVLFVTSNAMSAPITYDFSGTIVSTYDNSSALADYSLSTDTSTFAASFTYDPYHWNYRRKTLVCCYHLSC